MARELISIIEGSESGSKNGGLLLFVFETNGSNLDIYLENARMSRLPKVYISLLNFPVMLVKSVLFAMG